MSLIDPRLTGLADKIRSADIERMGSARFAVVTLLVPESDIDDLADALCGAKAEGGDDLLAELRRHQRDYPSLVHATLCGQAADRIEALVGLNTECKFALQYSGKRIEALEAALREIMEHPAGLYEAQYDIARAALAPEHDK